MITTILVLHYHYHYDLEYSYKSLYKYNIMSLVLLALGRKMDDSNQPSTVDEVMLDFHATSPSKNATQVLGGKS